MGVKISPRSMIGSTGLPKVAGFLFGSRVDARIGCGRMPPLEPHQQFLSSVALLSVKTLIRISAAFALTPY